jgi:hypothetical protein
MLTSDRIHNRSIKIEVSNFHLPHIPYLLCPLRQSRISNAYSNGDLGSGCKAQSIRSGNKKTSRPRAWESEQVLCAGYSNLQPRSSTPAVASEGILKRRRGRPRGSRNRNVLLAIGQFLHRISKQSRQKRLRKCPQISCRLRE